MTASPRFFGGIHGLRAVAAILVVGEHAAYVANHYKPIRMTSFGVVLFFAISGFVIALQRTKNWTDFAQHRLLRIYPSYWLAMIVATIALAAIRSPVSASASSLLLYPSTVSNSSRFPTGPSHSKSHSMLWRSSLIGRASVIAP